VSSFPATTLPTEAITQKRSHDVPIPTHTAAGPAKTLTAEKDTSEGKNDESPSAENTVDSDTAETTDANEVGAQLEDTGADNESADEPEPEEVSPGKEKRRIPWARVLAFGVLPSLVLVLSVAAGWLKWQDASARASQTASMESVAAAKDSAVAMLSYQPDSVENDLGAAQGRLTGSFKTSYAQLIHDVVIPGAKQRHVSAVATIPAAASVTANPKHAVVLLFVDQTVIIGTDAPTDTASTVRVSLDKVGNRWLISSFDPI
jgi:Mce-associated membrane protein